MDKAWIKRIKSALRVSMSRIYPLKYVFVDESWEDYLYWQQTDKKKLKKMNEVIMMNMCIFRKVYRNH